MPLFLFQSNQNAQLHFEIQVLACISVLNCLTNSALYEKQRLQPITPELKAAIEELEKRILGLGNVRVMERTRKAYYRGKKRARACFAILEISKDGVIARIRAEKPSFDDPENWSMGGIRKRHVFRPTKQIHSNQQGSSRLCDDID